MGNWNINPNKTPSYAWNTGDHKLATRDEARKFINLNLSGSTTQLCTQGWLSNQSSPGNFSVNMNHGSDSPYVLIPHRELYRHVYFKSQVDDALNSETIKGHIGAGYYIDHINLWVYNGYCPNTVTGSPTGAAQVPISCSLDPYSSSRFQNDRLWGGVIHGYYWDNVYWDLTIVIQPVASYKKLGTPPGGTWSNWGIGLYTGINASHSGSSGNWASGALWSNSDHAYFSHTTIISGLKTFYVHIPQNLKEFTISMTWWN